MYEGIPTEDTAESEDLMEEVEQIDSARRFAGEDATIRVIKGEGELSDTYLMDLPVPEDEA